MDVEIQQQAPWTILVAGPSAGACDSEEWLDLFEDLYERGVRHLIIDCQHLTVPTSPFLSALVMANTVMQRGQGCSWAVACNERIRRAIHITGLGDTIPQADSVTAAQSLGC